MMMYAVLLAGLLFAGDGLPPNLNKDYPLEDLLVRTQRNLERVYPLENLLVPQPTLKSDNDRYIRNLFRRIEGEYVPYPESDLALPTELTPVDPVLGYYPPSKRLLGRLSPLGFYPPSKNLLEKQPPKR